MTPSAFTQRQVLRCARLRQCYDPGPVGGVMAGRGYTIFDTAVGRCGIAWGDGGVIGVQLPEVREIETRRCLFRLYPDARELPPPLNVETAIDNIARCCAAKAPISPGSRSTSAAYPPSMRAFTRSRGRYRAAKPAPMAKSPLVSGLRGPCARSRRR